MRNDVHARRIEPQKERLAVGLGLFDKLQREVADFVVDGFHPLGIERPGILYFLFADLAQRGSTVGSSTLVAYVWSMLRGPTTFNNSCG